MSSLQSTKQALSAQTSPVDVLRVVSLLLVALGLVVSGYLSYVKLAAVPMVCVEGGAFNCDVVQSSAYSKMFGIPVAYMGFATYVLLGLMLLLENRVQLLRDYGLTLIFGITLFAFLFSMWLVYVQAALLQAFCVWCLAHELIMTFLFIIAGVRLWRSMKTT
jgi:uncharacterized membrane protein